MIVMILFAAFAFSSELALLPAEEGTVFSSTVVLPEEPISKEDLPLPELAVVQEQVVSPTVVPKIKVVEEAVQLEPVRLLSDKAWRSWKVKGSFTFFEREEGGLEVWASASADNRGLASDQAGRIEAIGLGGVRVSFGQPGFEVTEPALIRKDRNLYLVFRRIALDASCRQEANNCLGRHEIAWAKSLDDGKSWEQMGAIKSAPLGLSDISTFLHEGRIFIYARGLDATMRRFTLDEVEGSFREPLPVEFTESDLPQIGKISVVSVRSKGSQQFLAVTKVGERLPLFESKDGLLFRPLAESLVPSNTKVGASPHIETAYYEDVKGKKIFLSLSFFYLFEGDLEASFRKASVEVTGK